MSLHSSHATEKEIRNPHKWIIQSDVSTTVSIAFLMHRRENIKMQKAIMFTAYNGLEIIDTRPEAEIAYENMRYTEELVSKRNKRNSKPHKSFAEILAALL